MKRSRGQQEAELMAVAGELIQEYLEWAANAGAPTLSAIKEAVRRVCERVGAQMASVGIEGQAARQLVEAPRCPQCGAGMRYKGQKANDVESRVGTLRLERGYYSLAAPHTRGETAAAGRGIRLNPNTDLSTYTFAGVENGRLGSLYLVRSPVRS